MTDPKAQQAQQTVAWEMWRGGVRVGLCWISNIAPVESYRAAGYEMRPLVYGDGSQPPAPQAGEAAAEVERLRADLEQCQRDLQVMTELRDEARYERNRLRERLSAATPAGKVTVTTNEAGECVAVTRTDEEGRILTVIWERGGRPLPPPHRSGGQFAPSAQQAIAEAVAQPITPIAATPAEPDATCAECRVPLEQIGPGKYQHPYCSQAAPADAEDAARYRWLQRQSAYVGWSADPWLVRGNEAIDRAIASENVPGAATDAGRALLARTPTTKEIR